MFILEGFFQAIFLKNKGPNRFYRHKARTFHNFGTYTFEIFNALIAYVYSLKKQ